MRTLLATLFFFAAVGAFASTPDALEGGTSPNRRHEVVLDTAPETPVLLVRELPSHHVVGRLEWPGDPTGGDTQPLRTHAKVLWQPTGEAVAINTDERFYAYTSVLARQPESGKFVHVQFPDYKTLTGFPPPNPSTFARAVLPVRCGGRRRGIWFMSSATHPMPHTTVPIRSAIASLSALPQPE